MCIRDSFPSAHHATDVHFIHTNRPTGTFQEARPSFSGKHHLYGVKFECSVLPNGQACNWTHSYRGGLHDKDICLDNLRYHVKATKKTAAERAIVDHGEGGNEHPNHWAILEDKAYYGIQDDLRVILPIKRRRGRGYTQPQYEYNVKQSSDRVIVENFFGRSCQIGGIIAQKYVWSRERIDVIVDIVFSLTNYHIRLHPLRAGDGEYYDGVLKDLKRQADEAKTKGSRRQREYRQRQLSVQAALEGMDDRFTDDDEDEEGALFSDDDNDANRFADRQAESVSRGGRILDNTIDRSSASSSSSSSSSSSDDSSGNEDSDSDADGGGLSGGSNEVVAPDVEAAESGAGSDEEEQEEEHPTPSRRSIRKRKARTLMSV